MFKKLKDKIAEEVKQSPLKFQSSVQHFTQSVSPSLSFANRSPSDENTTLDSKEDEAELEDCHESEYDNSFTTVDLRSPVMPKNRHSSSSSSINSDLFPVYEFPRQLVLQSDLESCSEFDDGSSIHQFNNVTKENLYEKYRTALQKYHKYRGRFSDLQKYCKELQRELNKAKNVLSETQDKAIRRIVELKEQCSLEQRAKAHLEDALRNELEERGHLINTLNTKIELLKPGQSDVDDEKPIVALQQSLNVQNVEVENTGKEMDILKEKIRKLETLLNNAKDAIADKTVQIKDFQNKVEIEKNNLKSAQDHIANLEENINLMRRKEEEALLSLAENKLHVHQELEAKESQIKTLREKILELNEEMKKMKIAKLDTEKLLETRPDSKDEDYEALKRELQLLAASKTTDQNTIAEKDRLIREFKTAIDSSNEELLKLRNEMEASTLFSRVAESDRTTKQLESESVIQELAATKKELESKIEQLEHELSVVKTERLEKSSLCDSLEDKLTSLTRDLAQKETVLKENLDQVSRLTRELDSANAKIKEYTGAKKTWSETETHLKADKIVLEEKIKSIREELNSTQTELKNAKSTLSDFEKDANEKRKFERQLAAKENELAQLKMELERDKEAEHEMLVRTANLLEEINALKTKQDDHLRLIRTQKAQLQHLEQQLSASKQSKIKSDESNAELSEKIKQLDAEIGELRKMEIDMGRLRNGLSNSEMENDELKSELSQCNLELKHLRQSNQELSDVKLKLDSLQKEFSLVKVSNEELVSEKRNLSIAIEQLRTEYDSVVKELEDARSSSKDQERNNEVDKLKTENDQLVQQIRTLKHELDESHSSAAEAHRKLEENYAEMQKYVGKFVTDLQPILKNCILLKERLASEEARNQNLVREIAANADTIQQLQAQLALTSRESTKEGVLCNTNDLSSLKTRISSLKNEHHLMKNEILRELNSLRVHYQECGLKMNNGPIKIIRDSVNYISELEERLSDVEPTCARLKCEVREYEKVQQLSSTPSYIALESQLRHVEEECANKIRIIVTDYEDRLRQKDKKYQELESSALVQSRNEMTSASHEWKQISQNVGEEFTAKCENLEKQQQNADTFNNELRISEMKEQHAKELREIDKRWRSCLDKKIQEVEEKYKEEINELTKEWSTDRKRPISEDSDISSPNEIDDKQALEKYATRNEDAEALKKQVELLSNELCNYKKSRWKNIELDSYRNSDNSELSLEDCTELEYLRNILFEYMMGHQPLVLAKVLAAVVKFDSNQTQQVLEKEEQKLTLLGHLRLS